MYEDPIGYLREVENYTPKGIGVASEGATG
jgi:hypothetical protein